MAIQNDPGETEPAQSGVRGLLWRFAPAAFVKRRQIQQLGALEGRRAWTDSKLEDLQRVASDQVQALAVHKRGIGDTKKVLADLESDLGQLQKTFPVANRSKPQTGD